VLGVQGASRAAVFTVSRADRRTGRQRGQPVGALPAHRAETGRALAMSSALRKLPDTGHDLRASLSPLDQTLRLAPDTLDRVPDLAGNLRDLFPTLRDDLADVNPGAGLPHPLQPRPGRVLHQLLARWGPDDGNGKIFRILFLFNEQSPNLPINTNIGPLEKRNSIPLPGTGQAQPARRQPAVPTPGSNAGPMSRFTRPGRPLALCRTRGPLAPPDRAPCSPCRGAAAARADRAGAGAHPLDHRRRVVPPPADRRRGPPHGWPARSAGTRGWSWLETTALEPLTRPTSWPSCWCWKASSPAARRGRRLRSAEPGRRAGTGLLAQLVGYRDGLTPRGAHRAGAGRRGCGGRTPRRPGRHRRGSTSATVHCSSRDAGRPCPPAQRVVRAHGGLRPSR